MYNKYLAFGMPICNQYTRISTQRGFCINFMIAGKRKVQLINLQDLVDLQFLNWYGGVPYLTITIFKIFFIYWCKGSVFLSTEP